MCNKTSNILREFGLTDDQILEIAITDTLHEGMKILKGLLDNKWQMDTLTAMKTVKLLKEELK